MVYESLCSFFIRHNVMLRTLCRIGFGVSVLTVIVLSLLPDDELPDVSLSDKISHIIAYGEIVMLGLLGYRGRRQTLTLIVGLPILSGALEIGQLFVPGRSADWLDLVANCVGVIIGIVLARLLMLIWPATRHTGFLSATSR